MQRLLAGCTSSSSCPVRAASCSNQASSRYSRSAFAEINCCCPNGRSPAGAHPLRQTAPSRDTGPSLPNTARCGSKASRQWLTIGARSSAFQLGCAARATIPLSQLVEYSQCFQLRCCVDLHRPAARWRDGTLLLPAPHLRAQLGRFCSRDPISYAGGINLHECVGGSPEARTDPHGTSWLTVWWHRMFDEPPEPPHIDPMIPGAGEALGTARILPGVFEIHVTVPISKQYKDMMTFPMKYTPAERLRIEEEYKHMCESANKIHKHHKD